jgi:transposase
MKKHAYRARNINQFSLEKLGDELSERFIVAVDVAKREFVVGLAGPDGDVTEHLRFTHPIQTRQFLQLLEQLQARGTSLEVVMESTGTYGDALRGQLLARGLPTFAVSPKRCHDAAEIFDGVPSLHDAKATAILARLHAQGLSKPWGLHDQGRRELRAAIERRELYAHPLHHDQGRLEGLLARHWPEFGEHLDPNNQKSALALLVQYPGPQAVADAAEAAAQLLAKASRKALPQDKIAGVISSAHGSLGMPMLDEERRLLSELAAQMLELWRELERIDRRIAELSQARPEDSALAAAVGTVTTAVLVAMLGPASSYPSAGAYVKAMGLNLRECSSGESRKAGSGLRITKRGPGLARKYLYLATLRLIMSEPLARAWYEGRQAYQGGKKIKAVVALMRKYARGLWHVGRGQALRHTPAAPPTGGQDPAAAISRRPLGEPNGTYEWLDR